MTESTTFMTLLPASRKVVDLSITNDNYYLYHAKMRQTTLIKRYSPTILIRLTYFTYRIIVLFENQ